MDGMSNRMSIGDVARRARVQPSAIRYYESLGLLPAPARAGGKRRYDESVLDWLALVTLAREAGLTMAEIHKLVAGFEPGTPPAVRWRALATRKLAELEALVARIERMQAVLRQALACGCLRLEDCGHLLATRPERERTRPHTRGRGGRSTAARGR